MVHTHVNLYIPVTCPCIWALRGLDAVITLEQGRGEGGAAQSLWCVEVADSMTGSRYYRQKGGWAGRPQKIPTIRREGVGARVVVQGKRERGEGGQIYGDRGTFQDHQGGESPSSTMTPPPTHTLPNTTSHTGQASDLSRSRPLGRQSGPAYLTAWYHIYNLIGVRLFVRCILHHACWIWWARVSLYIYIDGLFLHYQSLHSNWVRITL